MVHFVNGLLLHSFADSRPATTQHFLNLAPELPLAISLFMAS
jgi:hypothetical protein